MRDLFNQQLERLYIELTQMGVLCEEAIFSACKALTTGDKEQVMAAKKAEQAIDREERAVEGLCMKLLREQAPVAQDLRIISSALKMISDMERIGDQAEDIADLARFVGGVGAKNCVHIDAMAEATIKMVNDSIESYTKQDLALANAVIDSDDIVDDLFDTVKKELIVAVTNGSNAEIGLDMLMVAKYLERIGDHATNIAEWVVYSITGTRPGAEDIEPETL